MSITPADDSPPERGRLLTAEQAAAEFFFGSVSPQWVRRNVRPVVRLGHSTVRWYAEDVKAWLELHRVGAA